MQKSQVWQYMLTIPGLGRQSRTPQGSLVSQATQTDKLQAGKKLCLQNQFGWLVFKEQYPKCAYSSMCMHVQIPKTVD